MAPSGFLPPSPPLDGARTSTIRACGGLLTPSRGLFLPDTYGSLLNVAREESQTRRRILAGIGGFGPSAGIPEAEASWSRVASRCGGPLLVLFFCLNILLSGLSTSAFAAGPLTAPGQLEAEGQLLIMHQDFKHSGRYLYFLDTPQRRVSLHFAKNPPTHLLTGDYVRVRGTQQSDGSLLLASGGSNNVKSTTPSSGSSIPLPNTIGAQSTLVILVNFQDAPNNQPYTTADAQNVTFGNASSFFQENSYQQTWLTGDVAGWFTIPLSSTSCDTSSIASYAQSAATAAGVNLSSYAHYLYAFPQNNNCGWAGSSFIGGNPSQSWINGTTGRGTLDVHVVDHELGHALGLWHSHLLDCGTAATIGSNCTVNEYGDILDTMGQPQTASPHYNAFQKQRLGWLNHGASPAIATVQASGTYVINPYELAGSGPNALKILKSIDPSTGARTWYYIEARQGIGFDAFLTDGTCLTCSSQNETSGVLFHVGTDSNGNSGDLLDMTPATPTYYGWFDPSLAVGQAFEDPAAGLNVTTTWVTSAGAGVNVQFSGALAVSTNQSTYSPGQTVSTSAVATYGGVPISNVSVSFTITKSNGSVVTGSTATGANGIAVYSVKLKQSDPAGNYSAAAAAMVKGNLRNVNAAFTVQ